MKAKQSTLFDPSPRRMISVDRATVGHWMLAMAFFAVALVGGAGAATGLVIPVLVIGGGLFLAIVFSIFGRRWFAVGSGTLFWAAFVLTFVLAIGSSLSPRKIYWVMELLMIAVTPLIFVPLRRWIRDDPFATWILSLYAVFLVFAIFSSVVNYSKPFSAVYQFLYNLKFLIMLLLGLRIGWSTRSDEAFWTAVKWLWILFGIFVAVQVVAPNAYFTIAKGAAEGADGGGHANPFAPFLPKRIAGPFQHSGLLALFACFFALACAVYMLDRTRKLRFGIVVAFLAYVITAFLTGQRQELAGLVAGLGVLVLVMRFRFRLMALVLGLLVPFLSLLIVFAILGGEHLREVAAEWGFVRSIVPINAARAVFFWDSIGLANQHFPFGTGLGTYASEAASRYDHSLYQQMGYGRYWWYRLNLFLVDTYWPSFIAESGWFGALAYFMIPTSLIGYSLLAAWRAPDGMGKVLWAIAFSGNFLAMITSLTSPLYSDPNAVAIIIMFFGIAYMYTWRTQALTAQRSISKVGVGQADGGRRSVVA